MSEKKPNVDKSTASTWRSTGSRRTKKGRRNKPPAGFAEWHPSDKTVYEQVSLKLRLWKATWWQCQPMQQKMPWWKRVQNAFSRKDRAQYRQELEEYKLAVQNFKPVDGKESFDLDF